MCSSLCAHNLFCCSNVMLLFTLCMCVIVSLFHHSPNSIALCPCQSLLSSRRIFNSVALCISHQRAVSKCNAILATIHNHKILKRITDTKLFDSNDAHTHENYGKRTERCQRIVEETKTFISFFPYFWIK